MTLSAKKTPTHAKPDEHLKLAILQTSLHWRNPTANQEQFYQLIEQVDDCDLILLPEMFSTGFSMQSEKLAEPLSGPSIQWMANTAQHYHVTLAGTLIIADGDHYYNRLVWMQPDGQYQLYDKRHLFRMAGEHKHYSPGQQRLIVELKGWRICPMICYDLRFPVWSRNNESFDLLVYLANWPAARDFHWQSLLTARAIENLCYVAGVNRIGIDGNDVSYLGNSTVIDAKGDKLLEPRDGSGAFVVTLSYEALQAYRQTFPAHLDADDFQLT